MALKLHEDAPPLEWTNENDAMTNYSFLLPWERWPRRSGAAQWLYDNWTISLWGFVAYVAMVHGGQRFMANRPAFDLRKACVIWNTAAAVFSVLGFWRSSHELLRVLWRHGFVHSACVSSWAQDAVFCFWINAFIVSKFFEFIDTAFLILRKRPVSFLHWYHHGTVLVFCWHGASTLTAAGRWFSWMNYGVHSVIYTYFALRTYGFTYPKWVSMSVTVVQMSQMVMGCWIGWTVYTAKTHGTPCHQTWSNVWMAFGIYSTFLLLFAHYFYINYVRAGGRNPRGSKVPSVSSLDESKPVARGAKVADDPQLRNRHRSAFSEAG
jgi:hypothetical protein